VHEGQAVRIGGEGDPARPAGHTAICSCYITVKQHTLFSRHKQRPGLQIPDLLHQASLGAKIVVPTLNGKMRWNTGGTQHGEVFKLRGKGLPDLRTTRRR